MTFRLWRCFSIFDFLHYLWFVSLKLFLGTVFYKVIDKMTSIRYSAQNLFMLQFMLEAMQATLAVR